MSVVISGSKEIILDNLVDVQGFSNVQGNVGVVLKRKNTAVPFQPSSVNSNIDFDPMGGLELNPSEEIRIKLDEMTTVSSGLGLSIEGVRVSTDEPSGLDFDTGGIFVKTNEPSGLQTMAAGISVKLNSSFLGPISTGSGIRKTAEGLGIPIIPRVPMISIVRDPDSVPLTVPLNMLIDLGPELSSNNIGTILTYTRANRVITMLPGYLFKMTAYFEMDETSAVEIKPQFSIDGSPFATGIWVQRKSAFSGKEIGIPMIQGYFGITMSEGSFLQIRFSPTLIGGGPSVDILGSNINIEAIGEFDDGRNYTGLFHS